MTARRDLAVAVEGCERQIDVLFAPLAVQMRLAVLNRMTGPTMTQEARLAILADLDVYLIRLRGHRRGDRAAIFEVVARWANAATLAPVDAAVTDIRRRAGDDLAATMERE